jgi:hypothetical protein
MKSIPLCVVCIPVFVACDDGPAARRGSITVEATVNQPYFVLSRTSSGTPLAWPKPHIEIVYDSAGTTALPAEEEFLELDIAFKEWAEKSLLCGSDTSLTFDLTGRQALEVGDDDVNLVKFRDDVWGRTQPDGSFLPYNTNAAALATLNFVDALGDPKDGTIVSADIEINAVDFKLWRPGEEAPVAQCASDIQNSVSHEIGRLLGLDINCWQGVPPRPLDSLGQALQACVPGSVLTPHTLDATLYPFQDCEETKKRSLEPGDIAGLCDRLAVMSQSSLRR